MEYLTGYLYFKVFEEVFIAFQSFHSVCTDLHSHQQFTKVFFFSASLPKFAISYIFEIVILRGVR